jgi:hypothetical protein
MTIKDLKLDILKQEIDLINTKINHFDDLRHRTKQMAMTLWLAALGVGLTAKLAILLWLAAFVPVLFWYIETVYHAYQEGYILRSSSIRRFIRTGEYEDENGTNVTLADCMNDDSFGSFPVPDDYGRHTVHKKDQENGRHKKVQEHQEHRRVTSVSRNLVKRKPMLFYLSLVGAAIILAKLVPGQWGQP